MLEFDDIQHILLTRTPAITGRYEFLSFDTPEGGRAWPLEAESDSDFAIFGIGTPVTFLRDGAGAVTSLVYHYNGQEIVATKLP